MATHDYVIANGTGAAVRSDLNNALAAIVSNNSSSTEPGTRYAYQFWADTNANVLKIRNSANDGWITLRELDGTLLMEDGSNSAPGLSFASDTNTGFFSGGADKIGFATGGVERLEIGSSEVVFNDPSNDVDFRVESNGNTHMLFVDAGNDLVGIGTSDMSSLTGNAANTFVVGPGNANAGMTVYTGTGNYGSLSFADGTSGDAAYRGSVVYHHNGDSMRFNTAATERARIDSSGRLLVGTSSSRGGFFNGSSGFDTLFQIEQAGYATASIVRNSNNTAAPNFILGKSRGTSNGATTVVSSGDVVGEISFQAADGAKLVPAASIEAEVDGTPGTSDMPGRLTFSTTADGASSPTERMRIDSSGKVGIGTSAPKRALHLDGGSGSVVIQLTNDTTGKTSDGDGFQLQVADDGTARVIQRENLALAFDTNNTERMRITSGGFALFGKTTSSISTAGVSINANDVGSASAGTIVSTVSAEASLYCNRLSNDGILVEFRRENTQQGTINVSGSTVSYNGGHLSRWSQLAGGAERTEILRGSVLSNLDEMCEWGEEDNEQLNRMKVSDVEGDANVAGVFQGWDDDDPTYENDFYCAMTGDFIIRIAQGTTVARGDLLMSAGDGTAKPQDDDIVRSKTIAKVTSTTVSTTYSDGSYCVPCVLMAC